MINNEKEYQVALERLNQSVEHIKQQRKILEKMNLSEEEINRVIEPLICFQKGIEEEIEYYRNTKK